MKRHITTSDDRDLVIRERLAQVEIELENLSRNMLAGVLSPTLISMLGERESEKAELKAQLAPRLRPPSADILPHPALLALFRQKVTALRESLDDDAFRPQAAATLRTLIESVTIYPDSEHGPEAEMVAKVSDLMAFTTNDNAAPKGGVSSSIAVVAGTGFEPVTFRL